MPFDNISTENSLRRGPFAIISLELASIVGYRVFTWCVLPPVISPSFAVLTPYVMINVIVWSVALCDHFSSAQVIHSVHCIKPYSAVFCRWQKQAFARDEKKVPGRYNRRYCVQWKQEGKGVGGGGGNNNNNNNNQDDIYGAVISLWFRAIVRVHPVYLMNADWAPGGRQTSDHANRLGLWVGR